MSATFSGQQSKLNLAGQRAAFTKALQAHGMTEDEGKKRLAAIKMAQIINRAPAKGFTQAQITLDVDMPSDVIPLIKENAAVAKVAEARSEDPHRLLIELRQTVDTSDQQAMGSGSQYVYAYGYRCAPDRLKVGRTDVDVVTRVASQISTGTPDKPMISLVICTEDCRGLEMAMQGVLRVRGRKVTGGGDEWYLTSRYELINIYKAVTGLTDGEVQSPSLAA